jgi:hypothetical protein
MKPQLKVTETSATTVSGVPLLYDSGIKYDDPYAYYDRWYDSAGNLSQGEKPVIRVFSENVIIKEIEEF